MKIERILSVCWAHRWSIASISFDDPKQNGRMKIIKEYNKKNGKWKMDTERICMDYYVEYLKECLAELDKKDFTLVSGIFSKITTGDFFDGVKMINQNIENYKVRMLKDKNALPTL